MASSSPPFRSELGVDGAGYDPASADAFASNADGTLTVVHQDTPDKYTVIQTLQTSTGSRNMGLDLATHRDLRGGGKIRTGARERTRTRPGDVRLVRLARDRTMTC